MKKLLLVVVVALLTVPVVAMGASPYISSFNGLNNAKLTGTINSVVPELNGKSVEATVNIVGEEVVMTVTYEGGKEIWRFSDTKLDQKEVDLKTNNIAMQYGATASGTATPNKQTFNVNCKNKATNDCELGIDSRFAWSIESSPAGAIYTVYGVDKDKFNDKTVPATKRHEFKFSKAN